MDDSRTTAYNALDFEEQARRDPARYGRFLNPEGKFADDRAAALFKERFTFNNLSGIPTNDASIIRQGANLSSFNRTLIGGNDGASLDPFQNNRQLNFVGDRAIALAALARGPVAEADRTVQDRLKAQLDIINREVAKTNNDPAALAIADRKLISLTQNLRPEDLADRGLSSVVAGANEREAGRLESYEKAAQAQRVDTAAATKSLAADMKEMLGLLKGKGAKIDAGDAGFNVNLRNDSNADLAIDSGQAYEPDID